MDTNNIYERPKFQNLRKAIDFILKCADDNDAGALFSACEIQPKELFLPKLFEDLKEIRDLINKEYSGRDFPEDTECTIGGCNLLWRFMHITFKKTEKEWYLYEVWMCR